MRALLTINAPALERGMSVTLTSGQEITIGSSRWADLKLEDRGLSGIHLQLSVLSDECWLRDLKSSTGTFVNGTRILATEICNGDVICSGQTSITITMFSAKTSVDRSKLVPSESNDASSIDLAPHKTARLSSVA